MDRGRAVKVFLITAACGVLPAFYGALTVGKLELHAAVNAEHTPLADLFFRWYTHVGDGMVPTAIALFILWRKDWRSFLMVGSSAVFSSIIAQLLKRTVFADVDRPSMFLDRMPGIDLVQGVELHQHFSFPSGHSTAAFSTALALAVLFARQAPAFILAIAACLVAYSRVYLSQHFTQDVLGGAFIGTVTALAVWWWLYQSHFSGKLWLDRRPFRGRR